MAQNTGADQAKHELDPRRKAALDTALAQVEKSFGKGSAMRLGDRPEQNVEVIPTGSLALDMALGIGGLPKGRIVEVYGPESSGKTTLALHVVANAQKAGGEAAFIDAEHALDPVYARKLGVDTDSLIVSQPDNGEQALEIADMLIRSGALDVIVIDSVAALVPKAEIEGDMGDSHVGLQARLMSQALRKLTGIINKTNSIGGKKVYYLSMEFLMGRSLKTTLYNLELVDDVTSILNDYHININQIYEQEPDAGLGNGGLGRLAACYLDAMATQGIPATGHSICYLPSGTPGRLAD